MFVPPAPESHLVHLGWHASQNMTTAAAIELKSCFISTMLDVEKESWPSIWIQLAGKLNLSSTAPCLTVSPRVTCTMERH